MTFGDIADHLDDFSALHPEQAAAMDAFAMWLAVVEDRAHDHDAMDRGSTV